MVYRDPGPIATFPLRPGRRRPRLGRWVWVALLPFFLWALLSGRIPSAPRLLIIALLVGLFLLPVLHSRKTERRAERLSVAGELRLFATHLEVPTPDGQRVLRFALDSLQVRVDHNEVQLNFITISKTDLLVLSDGHQERQLSHRLFGGLEQLRAAVTAIEAQQRQLRSSRRADPPPRLE